MDRDEVNQEMPLRILQVFASLDRGGAETMIINLYRKIDRSKIQFDFIANESVTAYAYEEEIVAMGGRVYKVPRYRGFNHLNYQAAWRKLLSDHPEWRIVHGHHTSPAIAYMPVAKSLGRHTIAHSHTLGGESSLKSNMKRLLRLPVRFIADGLFACSESAAEWMFGSKSGQVHIMNNAIDVESFAYDERTRAQVRKELGLEDKFVLGHVGGFKRVKNHMFLIQVFKEVQKLRPGARLLLIGDGGLLNDVKDKVKQLGLEEFVQFAGVRADVSSLLSAMDVFVFPSLYEGVPVTLIEAQSAGLPCIISDTITNEVFVTALLEALSLSESAHVWAEKISRFSNGYDRKDTSNEIISAGYDIKQSVTELERFYLNASGALIRNN